MQYQVYILFSSTIDQYYVGHTHDLNDRLYRHNHSGSMATKKASDWKIVYTEIFDSKAAAYQREMESKKKKSRKYIEALVSSAG